MDYAAVALWLASQGVALITKGKELWQSNGKDPAEFDAAVAASIAARGATVDAQRAAELAKMGGK